MRVTCKIEHREISLQVTRSTIQNWRAFTPILQIPTP